MGEAGLFRQYAKEAMHVSSKVTDENEKRTLVDLACTWALAALMSDRSFRTAAYPDVYRNLMRLEGQQQPSRSSVFSLVRQWPPLTREDSAVDLAANSHSLL